MPCAHSIRNAWSVCEQEHWLCSETERILVIVTPRILMVVRAVKRFFFLSAKLTGTSTVMLHCKPRGFACEWSALIIESWGPVVNKQFELCR